MLDQILTRPESLKRIKGAKPPKKETLKLYRQIWKFSREFNWVNHDGTPWLILHLKKGKT